MEALGANVARLVPKRREMASVGMEEVMAKRPGKVHRFSFLHATNALYQMANNNPRIEVKGCELVNDPKEICKQKRMTAINTALEVDIFGNTNAESIGDKRLSSPGGQPNFMEGAATAKDGKAIMALFSSNKGYPQGQSKIVMSLSGPITTPSKHVDYVATEWDITRSLRGASDSKRAFEIIRVANPLQRKNLAEQARAKGLLTDAQVAKLTRSIYHSVRLTKPALARQYAPLALQQGLITQAQHDEIIRKLPVEAPAIGGGEELPPWPPPPPPPPPQ